MMLALTNCYHGTGSYVLVTLKWMSLSDTDPHFMLLHHKLSAYKYRICAPWIKQMRSKRDVIAASPRVTSTVEDFVSGGGFGKGPLHSIHKCWHRFRSWFDITPAGLQDAGRDDRGPRDRITGCCLLSFILKRRACIRAPATTSGHQENQRKMSAGTRAGTHESSTV